MHENKKGSENMIQKETTGMILRKLRGDRTQEEIAAILGITRSPFPRIIPVGPMAGVLAGRLGRPGKMKATMKSICAPNT